MSVLDRRQAPRVGGPRPQRALGIVLAGALAVAALLPPRQVESGPVLCPFRLVTGLPCPACGLTRSWVHTAHGDLRQAVVDHPVGPLVFALAVATLVWMVTTRARVAYPRWLRRSAVVVLVLTVGVGLVRLAVVWF